ncbi:MAG: carboxypeptidase regulatory-like domain-containing protein [Acidobacteria bacterium]|nr:carboxypeptidase regulatory-like domain-containing protein [Acidobacteriota bacterium]
MKKISITLVLLLITSAMAFAQGTTGKLSGTVSGPDGLLPGAKVVVKDDSTNKEITLTTDGSGFYQVPQLEFGTYTIRISATGFKTLVGSGQKIDIGRAATFDATLEVGDVSAEVLVTAGADVISSGTAQVSSTISPQQIMTLPLITRSPLSLTLLQAGTSSNGLTTINGMRTSMTNITRDGINIQDTFIRSNATDFAPGRPSVDDTAEFTITTTNQEADQGSGSAQIRLVTPRGTKDFHGALFAYNRNNGFAANNFFNNRSTTASIAEKPSFRNRWQYGGKLSGPLWLPAFGEGGPKVWKDKAVFFFSYEGIKDPVSGAATRTILTPSAQAGAFTYQRTNSTSVTPFCPSQTIGSICTIPNVLGFAVSNGLAVPATIDPIIQNRILSRLPTASNFTGGDGLNTAGYRLLRRQDQTRDQYASRFDFDINDANSLLFIYNYNKEVNLRPDIDTGGFSAVPDGEQSSDNKQYTAAYRRVFSSNIVNEFRGGLFRSEVPFYRVSPANVYNLTVPLVTNPENNFGNQGRSTKSWNLQSNGDWVAGKHSFKFGGQLQFYDVVAYNDSPNGSIIPTVAVGVGTTTPQFAATQFSNIGGISTAQLGTANAMLGLFGGIVNNSNQMFSVPDLSQGFQSKRVNEPFKHGSHSLYLADRWQVSSQLTLSLGVRWEYYPPLTLGTGVSLEPLIDDIDNPIPSLLRQNGSYVPIGTNAGRENAYYRPQYDNFAPNLGFAWTPSFESGLGKFLFGKRSVIRGGYSHAFGNDSIITSIRNAAVGNQGLAATNVSVPNQNGRLAAGTFTLPTTPTFIAPPRSYLQNNTSAFSNFGTVFAIDPNIEVTRVKQYSFGIQREFWDNTAFEVRYVGTDSNNMVRSIDYNQIDIRSNGFAADFNRAANNDRLCQATAGCTTGAGFNPAIPGSVALPVFSQMGANALLTNATILGQIRAGTPADLALVYITNNLNNHPTVANPSLVPFVKFLANPASGVVNLLENGAYYQYHSLQTEVRRRFSQGLYFQANYTFSKNIGNAAASNGSQSLVEPFLDNQQPELDRTRVDFDQTHAFNFNGVYQLPFGKGKAFLSGGGWSDKVFGGWEFSGIVQINSGVPITFVDPRGTLNRAARSGRQTANTSLTTSQIRDLLGTFEQNGRIYWINPSIICSNGAATAGVGQPACAGQVFFNVPAGQTGSMGRAIINAPTFFNVDAALLKNIRFTEDTRLQFRVEAFNALNKVNFFPGASIQNIGSTTFGQITSAGAARQLQLAVRFEF